MTKRTMTDEHKSKLLAARKAFSQAKSEGRQAALNIGPYQCFRLDEDNWVIREGDDGKVRYYPSKLTALQSLLDLRISEANARSIREVLSAVTDAKSELILALRA